MGSPFPLALELRLHVFAKLLGRSTEGVADLLKRLAVGVTTSGNHGVALVGVHEASGFEQAGFILLWDGHEAVLVCMDQLARLDFAAKGLHLAIPSHGMHGCVAHTE